MPCVCSWTSVLWELLRTIVGCCSNNNCKSCVCVACCCCCWSWFCCCNCCRNWCCCNCSCCSCCNWIGFKFGCITKGCCNVCWLRSCCKSKSCWIWFWWDVVWPLCGWFCGFRACVGDCGRLWVRGESWACICVWRAKGIGSGCVCIDCMGSWDCKRDAWYCATSCGVAALPRRNCCNWAFDEIEFWGAGLVEVACVLAMMSFNLRLPEFATLLSAPHQSGNRSRLS